MSTIRVLIVESHSLVAEKYKILIEAVGGFQVTAIVSTRQSILDILNQNQPMLIIIDDKLPDFSTIEIIASARRTGNPSDFIILTDNNDGISISLALRYGAADYILKPFAAERLKASLLSYRNFSNQINKTRTLDQEDIDSWYKMRIPVKNTSSN